MRRIKNIPDLLIFILSVIQLVSSGFFSSPKFQEVSKLQIRFDSKNEPDSASSLQLSRVDRYNLLDRRKTAFFRKAPDIETFLIRHSRERENRRTSRHTELNRVVLARKSGENSVFRTRRETTNIGIRDNRKNVEDNRINGKIEYFSRTLRAKSLNGRINSWFKIPYPVLSEITESSLFGSFTFSPGENLETSSESTCLNEKLSERKRCFSLNNNKLARENSKRIRTSSNERIRVKNPESRAIYYSYKNNLNKETEGRTYTQSKSSSKSVNLQREFDTRGKYDGFQRILYRSEVQRRKEDTMMRSRRESEKMNRKTQSRRNYGTILSGERSRRREIFAMRSRKDQEKERRTNRFESTKAGLKTQTREIEPQSSSRRLIFGRERESKKVNFVMRSKRELTLLNRKSESRSNRNYRRFISENQKERTEEPIENTESRMKVQNREVESHRSYGSRRLIVGRVRDWKKGNFIMRTKRELKILNNEYGSHIHQDSQRVVSNSQRERGMVGPMMRSKRELKILNRNSKPHREYEFRKFIYNDKSKQLIKNVMFRMEEMRKISDHRSDSERQRGNFIRKSELRKDMLALKSKRGLKVLDPETMQKSMSESRKFISDQRREMVRTNRDVRARKNNYIIENSKLNYFSLTRINSKDPKETTRRNIVKNKLSTIIGSNDAKIDKFRQIFRRENNARNQHYHAAIFLQRKSQYKPMQNEAISSERRSTRSNVNSRGCTRKATRDSNRRVEIFGKIRENSESSSCSYKNSRRHSLDQRNPERETRGMLTSRRLVSRKKVLLERRFLQPQLKSSNNELTVVNILFPEEQELSNIKMRLNSKRNKEFRLSIRSTSTRELHKPSNSHLIQYQRRLYSRRHFTRESTAPRTSNFALNTRRYINNMKNDDNRELHGTSVNRQLLVRKRISPASQLTDNNLFDSQDTFKEDTYPTIVNYVGGWSSTAPRRNSKTERFNNEERSLFLTKKRPGLFDQIFLGKNTAFSIGFDVLLGLVILAFVIDDSDKGFLSRFKNQIHGLCVF